MSLLDANAFIEARRFYYGFDLAPGFRQWLADPARRGRVASLGAVKDEIMAGTDELVAWARDLDPAFWLPDTQEAVSAIAEVSAWATDPERSYTQTAIDTFLDSPDLQLVGHARAVGGVVVTRERPAPNSQRRIKIPDVCAAFGIDVVDPIRAHREMGLTLIV